MSASLLRRVAEAADAMRDGRTYWMVVDSAGLHNLSGVYPTEDSAQTDPMLRRGYQVIGPILTPIDFGLPGPVLVVCQHIKSPPNQSIYDPRLCPAGPFPLRAIRGMRLVIDTGMGDMAYTIDPHSVDALFFDASVFDKFLAPYYARLYSPAYAQELRGRLQTLMSR